MRAPTPRSQSIRRGQSSTSKGFSAAAALRSRPWTKRSQQQPKSKGKTDEPSSKIEEGRCAAAARRRRHAADGPRRHGCRHFARAERRAGNGRPERAGGLSPDGCDRRRAVRADARACRPGAQRGARRRSAARPQHRGRASQARSELRSGLREARHDHGAACGFDARSAAVIAAAGRAAALAGARKRRGSCCGGPRWNDA